MTFKISIEDTHKAVTALRGFVPYAQLDLIGMLCRGEEGDFFRSKLVEYAERVATMPHTYQQDGKGDDALVYLHYFGGSADWWITEKDMEVEQHQAFGYADLFGDGQCAELGYISLVELCGIAGVELDLHWTPKTLREVKADRD